MRTTSPLSDHGGGSSAFCYTAEEIDAIRGTLHHPVSWFDVPYLETCARSYLFRVSRSRDALPKKQIAKECAERDRIVERVRHAVPGGDRAERMGVIVENMVAEDQSLSRTRLLAQAMFDGEINEFELERLIVRRYLADPDRLEWRGAERWLYADDRKKLHRREYLNSLICFWAEDRGCRPDKLSVSPGASRSGDRLMDFILAAASRPMLVAGEEIGPDQLMNLVQAIQVYWKDRPWGDPELEAVLAEETLDLVDTISDH